jgi:hypothetical protein
MTLATVLLMPATVCWCASFAFLVAENHRASLLFLASASAWLLLALAATALR